MHKPGTQYALFESAEAMPVEQAAQDTGARRFSDYVVYVDESGDHSLASNWRIWLRVRWGLATSVQPKLTKRSNCCEKNSSATAVVRKSAALTKTWD